MKFSKLWNRKNYEKSPDKTDSFKPGAFNICEILRKRMAPAAGPESKMMEKIVKAS